MIDEGPDPGEPPTIAEPAIEEPVALGLADAAAADPATRDRARVLIDEQIKLARMQRRHLHTQHIRDRFLVAFDLALAVGGLIVVGIMAALFWDAWTSRSVIIDAFDVPQSFASQGLSGKVVASELLDRLKEFQDATRTNQEKRAVEDAWSNRIELQIPEAGISIDEVENLLHRWLSRDEHISGSVVDDGKAIALTVRGDRFAAKSFSGSRGQLHALAVKAAEYLYGGSEPYLFCVYLENQGRDKEVIALARSAYAAASPTDKPLLLNVWANALSDLGRYRDALDKVREAVRLKSDFWLGYDTMMAMQLSLGEEEAVVATGRGMERRARRGGWFAAHVSPAYWENLDYLVNDWPAFHRDIAADMAANGGQGTEAAEDAPIDAWALALMHDRRAAELELETSPGAGRDPFVIAQSALVRGAIALDFADYAGAASSLKAADVIVTKNADVASNIVPPVACWLALAETLSGASATSDADIKRGGHYVDCRRFAGDIADRRGDRAGAEKAYAAATALAPSAPSAYESWGEMLLRRGAFDGAIAKFQTAHEKGPGWADPLERWGEALAGEGKFDEAVNKFSQAADDAPNWGHLYLMWGRALASLRRHADAVAQFRRAEGFDLSSADRTSLSGCCGG